MKQYMSLFFSLTLLLLTACSVHSDTVSVPDGAVSAVPQENLSEQEEQESDSAALSALRLEASEANCPCAMAYLNFETEETALPSLIGALAAKYPLLTGASCVDAGGEDLYVIVPTDPQANIVLYRCDVDDNGELKAEAEPVGSFSDGKIVFLRCNQSDIVPNTLVHITDSNDATFEFSPFLSLRDGRIHIDGVYDFTEYPPNMPNE